MMVTDAKMCCHSYLWHYLPLSCPTIDILVLLRFDRLQLTFYASHKAQTWYAGCT